MPQISRFFGIIIKMYYNDHQPAHFHAEYNEYVAEISIETFEVLKGELPGVCWGLFWNGPLFIGMNCEPTGRAPVNMS